MADKRMEEYRAYYDARVERYANNPKKKHSFEAESNLRDLMYKYDTFEEIKDNLGSLNIDCAFAAWQDQYEMESEYYKEVEDPVRKKCADKILDEVEKYPKTGLSNSSVIDMGSKITEVTNQSNNEIYYDEASGKALLDEWKHLDEIDVYSNAVVPGRYKYYMQKFVSDIKKEMKERNEKNEKYLKAWSKGRRIDPNLAKENRYRRLMPYSDEDIEKQLKKYKEIINIKG